MRIVEEIAENVKMVKNILLYDKYIRINKWLWKLQMLERFTQTKNGQGLNF